MKTYPTLEEIKAKKGEFREKIKKNEKPKRNEELNLFLSNIKLEIKQAIQNGASNQKIVISLAKFADFCAENNIATNARKRKAKTDTL